MTLNKLAIANGALYASAGFNLEVTLRALWRGEYATAALQSMLVALLAAWMAVKPKYEAWIDARLAEAIAQQAAAGLVLEELRRLQQAGELQSGVQMAASVARTH